MKRKSAYFAAIQEENKGKADITDTVTSSSLPSPASELVKIMEQPKVKERKKRRIHEKFTTYLSQTQQDKLEDLAYKYKKKHHKKITTHDILRYLIDTCSNENILLAEIRSSKE